MRKKFFPVLLLIVLVFGMAACTTETPYASMRGWIMRQNSTPRYFASYDVFFVPPSLFTGSEVRLQEWSRRKETEIIYNYVYYQLAEQFGSRVRFFVPQVHALNRDEAGKYLFASSAELEKTDFENVIENTLEAFNFYLQNYHVTGRPFVMVGQGQGAVAVYEMMKRCRKITPENGFVAAYLTGMPGLRADRIEKDFSGRGIRPAQGMLDTGVILGWCIQGHSEPREIPPDPARYVINPLSWKTDTAEVPGSANLRSVFYNEYDPNPLERRLEIKNCCGAVIDSESGTLRILPAEGQEKAAQFFARQKFRCNDLGLFFQSFQTNMQNRVEQYRHQTLWRDREKRSGTRK